MDKELSFFKFCFCTGLWQDSAHPRRCLVLGSFDEMCWTKTSHSGSQSICSLEVSWTSPVTSSSSDLRKTSNPRPSSTSTVFFGFFFWKFPCCIWPVSSPREKSRRLQKSQGPQSFMSGSLAWSRGEARTQTQVWWTIPETMGMEPLVNNPFCHLLSTFHKELLKERIWEGRLRGRVEDTCRRDLPVLEVEKGAGSTPPLSAEQKHIENQKIHVFVQNYI